MNTQEKKVLSRHIVTLCVLSIFVFFTYHYSLAQETGEGLVENPTPTESSEETLETVDSTDEVQEGFETQEDVEVQENISENTPIENVDNSEVLGEEDVFVESDPEVVDDIPNEVEDVAPPVEVDEEPTTLIEEIQDAIDDFFTEEEVFEELETETDFVPFVLPDNIPKVRAFPETQDFETHREATHSCYIKNFKSDISFLQSLSNTVVLSNPSPGASSLEISGLPEGYEIIFTKNNSSKMNIATGQKEVVFSVSKLRNSQKGSFNVTFIYTQEGLQDSTTTCQMNLVNDFV